MPLFVSYHPFTWMIKYHTSADGKSRYLQDMNAKLKWVYSQLKDDTDRFIFLKARSLNWDDYCLVHNREYVNKIRKGIESEIQKYSWITWSRSFVREQLYTGGVLYNAAREALERGITAALITEGHHAQKDHGSGFCTFNHLAVVVNKLISERIVSRIAVVDLDYHLGDGTISLLSGDERVWIFDLYGAFHKSALFIETEKKKNVFIRKIGSWKQYKEALKKTCQNFWMIQDLN